jgi:hypothetical protein
MIAPAQRQQRSFSRLDGASPSPQWSSSFRLLGKPHPHRPVLLATRCRRQPFVAAWAFNDQRGRRGWEQQPARYSEPEPEPGLAPQPSWNPVDVVKREQGLQSNRCGESTCEGATGYKCLIADMQSMLPHPHVRSMRVHPDPHSPISIQADASRSYPASSFAPSLL